MRSRQQSHPGIDVPDGARVTPVDASLASENAPTHQPLLMLGDRCVYLISVPLGLVAATQLCNDPGPDVDQPVPPFELVADLVGIGDRADAALERRRELGVLGHRLPFPGGFARFRRELFDRRDDRLHLLVTEQHRAEHHLLGQLLRLRFHHQHRRLGAGDHQIELGPLQLRGGRIQHVAAIDVSHSDPTDGPVEGDPGYRDGGRRSRHRHHVGIDLRVQ